MKRIGILILVAALLAIPVAIKRFPHGWQSLKSHLGARTLPAPTDSASARPAVTRSPRSVPDSAQVTQPPSSPGASTANPIPAPEQAPANHATPYHGTAPSTNDEARLLTRADSLLAAAPPEDTGLLSEQDRNYLLSQHQQALDILRRVRNLVK